MNKTIVIYHRADFDGIFCREIAKKFLPEAELIGWDYGDPVPTPDVVSADDTLYMLDISVEGLMGHPKLIWIDHHKSAMEKFTGKATAAKTGVMPHEIAGYRIDGVAACRLAWQWFGLPNSAAKHAAAERENYTGYPFPNKQEFIDRTITEPLAVRLAGEYDIWDKRDPDAEVFQHGLRSQPVTEQGWALLLSNDQQGDNFVHSLLLQGRSIQYSKTQENEGVIKAYGFDVQFEGLKFLACNHARFNSHLFTAGIKPEHDALLRFNWTGQHWRVSLYHAPGKEQHDLSLIAVKYGGGGHRGACGFRAHYLPFIENNPLSKRVE